MDLRMALLKHRHALSEIGSTTLGRGGRLAQWLQRCEARTSRSVAGLQVGAFFRNDGPFHRADLQADPTIDAGLEIDPIKAGALGVGALAWMDAGHRAGIDAVGDPFADVGDDGVCQEGLADPLILRIQPTQRTV